jgi:hypothetical protein
MPYKIAKVEGGYKVKHGDKAFSKHPQSKEMAEAQRRAIAVHEFGQGTKHGS